MGATRSSPVAGETSQRSGEPTAATVGRVLRRLPSRLLVGLVRGYQLTVSPWTAPSCRYYPSCSQYAVVAIQRHGALRGGWLAVRRLGRCHPWTPGGVDDVPPVRAEKGSPHPHGSQRARSST